MEILSKLFGEQSGGAGSVFQIILDLVVILIVLVNLWLGSKKSRSPEAPNTEVLYGSLAKIIEETQHIAEQFEGNLRERQILIQQVLNKLDSRIKDAERICGQMENLAKEHSFSVQPTQQPIHPVRQMQPVLPRQQPQSDYQKVVQLARKGLDAEAIAQRLQKPVGEIQLILNLQKLSSSR